MLSPDDEGFPAILTSCPPWCAQPSRECVDMDYYPSMTDEGVGIRYHASGGSALSATWGPLGGPGTVHVTVKAEEQGLAEGPAMLVGPCVVIGIEEGTEWAQVWLTVDQAKNVAGLIMGHAEFLATLEAEGVGPSA